MFNVTVLKMRDIVKYLVGFMIIIGIIVYATRFFAYKAENKEDKIKSSWLEKNKIEEKKDKSENVKMQSILMWNLTSCLDKTIPAMASTNEEYNKIEKENKEIKRAVRALDFISADEKERERYNSIIMAEYNRKVTEGKVREEGKIEGIKLRS